MSRPKRGGGRSGGVAKEDHYKAQKDKALRQLEQAQALLQVTKEKRVLIHERSNVLSDMISMQACVMELLRRHWMWMYDLAPEATAAEPASTTQSADGCSSEQQSLLHQHQYMQHTCMRQLQAATPQQLQQALTMTPQDWVNLGRCHFRELVVLLEFVNRPPEAYLADPSAFDSAAAVAASLASSIDAVCKTPAAAAAAAAAAGDAAPAGQQPFAAAAEDAEAAISAAADGSLPWERDPMRLLVGALWKTGQLSHLALLHACMAFMYAGSLNMETMQPEMPSPRFWRGVVERLHLSPTQRMHFQAAVQEYQRLTRAASAAGLDLVQHTKHFSLSDVAAQYVAEGQPASATGPEGSPEPGAAAAAASSRASPGDAGSAAAGTAAGGEHSGSNGTGSRCTSGSGSNTGGSAASAAVDAGASTGASANAAAGAGASAGSAAAAAAGSDAAAGNPLEQLDAKLQRHLQSYFLNIYLVNAFLANSLTPYQHALMWTASYPYFPNTGAMAEALDAVPSTGPQPPLPPHIQAHISSSAERHIARRSALMAHQKQELRWWEQ